MAFEAVSRPHPWLRRRRPHSSAVIRRLMGGTATTLFLYGCEGVQSALAPSGENARELAALWWLMFSVLSAAFVIVVAALFYALYRTPSPNSWIRTRHVIIGGGIIFPAITIVVFFLASLQLSWLTAPRDREQPAVEVIGHQFWWEVRYPNGEASSTPIISANEVRLPVGEPVYFDVTTEDVIHSFWIPKLGGKIDMIPGQINRISLKAEKPGVFRGQCYEFCGAQHANMAFSVIAMPREEFAAWLANEAKPAPMPEDLILQQGQRAFVAAGCGSCHRIRGTISEGASAPDLTHVAGRLTLAAGMFNNTPGNMAAWIVSAQQMKPGNNMPSFNGLDGPTLRALTAYLASLE
jgi:cytochrome c oxidase subunit II